MILTCPSCGTQYVVKDGAIPPEGRQVRCASCKHSWHQDSEGAEQAAVAEAETPAAPLSAQGHVEPERDNEDESVAEAVMIEPRSGPEAEERAFEEAAIEDDEMPSTDPTDADGPAPDPYANAQFDLGTKGDPAPAAEPADWDEPPLAEEPTDDFVPFAAADDTEPPGKSRLWPILLAALVIIALAAAFWFLASPDLKAKLGIAAAGTSPLALVTTHMDRQRLESGNELLTVSGRVINPTGRDQDVPPLQAQLRTRAGKLVYSWTIAPPARSLPPGSSASFNSAEVNVPPGGDELTITLGGGRG